MVRPAAASLRAQSRRGDAKQPQGKAHNPFADKGYRIRLVRVKVIQTEPDGRHLCEIYFGAASSLITDSSRAVDILAVPEQGTASTRSFPHGQGPRGRRGEPLSLRWRGTRPATAHKVIIEYTEES